MPKRSGTSANTPPPQDTLPRVLGPFDAITVVVGSIIGSGIFLKASVIAGGLGSFGPIICVWIFVGIVTLCGSLALAELAAMLPHAGGPYVYLREAYGRLPAFLWGWTEFWIIRTGSLGALACATVIYGNRLLQGLQASDLLPKFMAGHVPLSHWEQAAAAIVLVLIVSTVNIIGTRWSARVQNVTTVIKVSFLLFLIIGPILLAKADTANLLPLWPSEMGVTFWRAMGVAMIAVLWPYDGWINIGPVAEEIREPQRNVPLALTFGMLIVIVVYAGANISYHLVLPMAEVQQSPAVAAEVTRSMLGNAGAWVAALGVMFSTLGALNSNLLAGPRIYFAMSRDNLFPAALHRIHPQFRTPANAIAAQMSWSLVLLVGAYAYTAMPKATSTGLPSVTGPAQAFDHLTDFVIFGGSIFYAMAVGAVFVLRRKRPDLPRPYRTWGYPFTPALYLLAFAAALVSMLVDKWEQTAFGLVIIVAGIAFFFVWSRPQPK